MGSTGSIEEVCKLLEALMLVCFGLSWPISVAKNIRAKSARNMSLRFTLLIIAGYVAGIAAKIVQGEFHYVFAVYIVNLAIVSVNVVVYFINKGFDKQLPAYRQNDLQKEAV